MTQANRTSGTTARGSLPFENRVALVTGAAHGIGRAIAERLARDGARLVLCDIDEVGLAGFAEDLGARQTQAVFRSTDVRLASQTDALAAAAVDAFSAIDIVICSAGLVSGGAVYEMTDAQWDVVVDVNLRGAFNTIRSASAALLNPNSPERHRKIIFISSIAGVHGGMTVNYSAAKAGQIGFAKALAREWAEQRINVNVIAPGRIMGTKIGLERGADWQPIEPVRPIPTTDIPIGREGQPEDIAAAAAFLAGPESDFITGQVLEIHGGLAVVPKPVGMG